MSLESKIKKLKNQGLKEEAIAKRLHCKVSDLSKPKKKKYNFTDEDE